MATYLKRSSKPFDRLEPSLHELICPVCRTLLREPVTLPCAHNLCLRCLRGTVKHNSLTCPLCRQRVGSWLRTATKAETLVNAELWQLIRSRFPRELELADSATDSATPSDAADLDLNSRFAAKKILSAAGEIRREYEMQLQIAEEEMWRQREKERLASEALIRKIQEEEEQQKLVQLAQDQLLARTLAKQDVVEKSSDLSHRTGKNVNLNHSKADANQSKSSINQKMSAKSKDAADAKKQNVTLASILRSERYTLNIKPSSTNVQKESTETFSSQKPVPIHNAVTRVVTHQSRINQPNNSSYPTNFGDFIGAASNIYGLQSKEELQVPSDVLSSKKKKLGVEVCVTNVEGEERIGSAESAGSHDSINQEIHHFKPIKALPRTPLRTTLDGRHVDPKLIRVLPILKRVSNAVPKPPTPTHLKKMFGCSWSAFKRISRQQQVLQKDSPSMQQQQQHETKKTDKKSEQSRNSSKSSKSLQELDVGGVEVAFDSNKNYTKNVNKIINGTKVSKKLNLDEQVDNTKHTKRASKLKNGLFLGKHKPQKEAIVEKTIEVVEIDDDESIQHVTPDPLAITPKIVPRPPSPMLEHAMENIAERIKRRKTMITASNTDNVHSAAIMTTAVERSPKSKSKKTSSTRGRKQKTKKITPTKTKAKTKPKTVVTTTLTSQIKRLAARSAKRPRYTEDTESEDEPEEPNQSESSEENSQAETNERAVIEKANPQPSPLPSPPKRSRKQAKPKASSKKQKESPVKSSPNVTDDEEVVKEQERLERLAAQEKEDRELAMRLQAQFDSMERIAGRTRRGAAARLPSPMLLEPVQECERRPRKRAPIK